MIALTPSVRTLRVFQILWVIGFLIGTTTHTADLILGGLDVYGGFPPGVRLFWVTLTVLDPITAVLIILRRRAGIVLGIAVIVADIAVNWTVFVLLGGLSWFGVISQSLFAVLILATARPLWIWFGRSSTRERAEPARAA
ncbi:hypothetical protein [Plantibacter sp. CFBP 13570]|uniref:hypothetical protein n=1 Tax=Plantibacter sp. CFBP 13570 TaxID=2775272 RepID=UPI001930DA94|nr:hypothetical protein [Plantibacter sp. CFBP 13570]MBD8536844.1 hypothetical protein [Plantibacter sp. CFBP 13570]